MNILGISAFYHDAAAAILCEGRIIAAAQEERFSRIKNDAAFPQQAIAWCLAEAGLRVEDLDAVVFYEKPFLKFERLLETYYANAPGGLISFLKSMPVWIGEKAFMKKKIKDGLKELGKIDHKKTKFLFPEHHLSHIASAYFASGLCATDRGGSDGEERLGNVPVCEDTDRGNEHPWSVAHRPPAGSAVITLDGVGEWATSTIGYADGKDIKIIKQTNFPHSIGLLYSAFTYYLGFKVNSGEYKLMGLAPYGNAGSDFYKKCLTIIKTELVKIYEDGSIWLNQKYFSYATGLRMVPDAKWEKLFGLKRRLPESEMTQAHCDMALAIQTVTEEVVINMAKEAKRLTGSNNLCMAGGVVLNCVANGKLADLKLFNNIYIQPAAGDAGGALGAALAGYYIYYAGKSLNVERFSLNVGDSELGSSARHGNIPVCEDTDRGRAKTNNDQRSTINETYLGPGYTNKDIIKIARRYNAPYKQHESFDELSTKIATLLAEGKIIGLFQGRMEFGPRALGNRSIIADPRNPDIQKELNLKTKYRESFRPFAPAVLEEDASHYFEMDRSSPYMLFVHKLRTEFRLPVPDNYNALDWKQKLETPKSQFPAITHVDFSARVQTVNKLDNKRFYDIIHAFKGLTGCGMVVNTSMNVRGEPMVCSPEEAYLCFMKSGMDYLVCEDIIFEKTAQPSMPNLKLNTNDTCFKD